MIRSDNEQEFVLGNKQLLSAFFVVVMLLGVFFAMGYIVGHNTGSDGGTKKTAQPEPSASSASPQDSSSPSSTVPVSQGSGMAQNSPTQTMPAQETSPAPALPERTVPEEKPVEKPVERRVERTVEKNAAVHVNSAPGHTYLQVSAVKRPAADSIVQTLKDKGFPAVLGESSKPLLFRVLVGPYADTESLSKAKSDLKAIGFDAVVSK